jgi:cell division transport system permease protein
VLFIVGNTIRLTIEDRKNEIKVIKLVGGTNSFIARPFLYMGLLLGASGALFACLLMALVQLGTKGLVDNVLSLYGATLSLQGYGIIDSLTLFLLGCCLGWAGALISTAQQLFALDC